MSRHVGGSGVPSFDAPRSAWTHACLGADPSSGAGRRRRAGRDGAVVHARERAPARGLVALLAPSGARRVVLVSGVQSRVHLDVLGSRRRRPLRLPASLAKIVFVGPAGTVGSSVEPGALVQPEPRGRVVDVARVDAERVGRLVALGGRRARAARRRVLAWLGSAEGPGRPRAREQQLSIRARATTPA